LAQVNELKINSYTVANDISVICLYLNTTFQEKLFIYVLIAIFSVFLGCKNLIEVLVSALYTK
jgi:hypothetical protein